MMYKLAVIVAIIVQLILLFITSSVFGDVIEQNPQPLLLPVGGDGNFICKVNSSANVTGITWFITTAGGITLTDKMSFNSLGFTIVSSSLNLSVLSVKGNIDNNNTDVKCSVNIASQILPVQSPLVKLILYGPPNAVNFSTITPLLHGFRLSWTTIQPILNNDGNIIPFNYSINIKSPGKSLVQIVSQTETEYFYETKQSDSCTEYNFTLQTVNDAGYSDQSTVVTLRIPDVPRNITIVTSKVIFNSTGDPVLRIKTLQNDECCDSYPVKNYTITLVDQYSNTTHLTIPSNANNTLTSCDSHVTLPVTDSRVLSDRRYTVSLVASNQFGDSESSNSIEIVTTSLRQIRAELIGNQLTINCHFANRSKATGCSLQIFLNSTELIPLTNITIFERNPLNALVSTGMITLEKEYPPSSLVVIATDYDSNEDLTGEVTFTIIPTHGMIATTSTTSVPTSVSMTTTSAIQATTLSTIVPTVSVSVGGTNSKTVSQTLVAIIVGVSAGTLTVLAVIIIITGLLVRSCTRKTKGKTFIVDNGGDCLSGNNETKHKGEENGYVKNNDSSIQPSHDKSDTLQSSTTIRSEDVQTDFRNIVGPDQDDLVTPYGITTLVHPDLRIAEPVYQELPDKPSFFSQSSTTPLLEASITPPPIAPRERHLPSRAPPVYHILEESAGSLSSNEIMPVLYDEVPVFQGTEDTDGVGVGGHSLSSGGSSIPAPNSSSPLLSTSPSSSPPPPLPPPLSSSPSPPPLPPPLSLSPSASPSLNNSSSLPSSSNNSPQSCRRHGNGIGTRKTSLGNGRSRPPHCNGSITDYPRRQAVSNIERLNHNVMIVESQQRDLGKDSGDSYPSSPTRSYMYTTPTKGQFAPPTFTSRQFSNDFVTETNGDKMKKSVSVPIAMRQRCNSTGGTEESVYDKLEKERSKHTWTLKRTLV